IWEAEVEELRWDARGWIRYVALSANASDWKQTWFELAFGLRGRGEHDPHSSSDPVRLPAGPELRGSIDLIEENAGRIRITDHKTGQSPSKRIEYVVGGEVITPLFNAEPLEA